ncbi:unnamed protein product [Mytilus edulis]|uniref:Mab-21-like nucleotidyltransferase domain-containing protein n=1 Tax=Mytilus edulis TaxID=6550 RepID=A0A8S3RTG0_MYTED|nr:unnamed protein product [Mytilus edulis]
MTRKFEVIQGIIWKNFPVTTSWKDLKQIKSTSTNESNSPKRLEIARNVSYLNATDVEDKYKSVIDDTDHVDCLMGAKWPDEASEWTKRPRFCNWPTKELINAIIESGYILAGVGSKESNHSHIQWRLSFNRAELLLIESFNETQIHCIWLLKSA